MQTRIYQGAFRWMNAAAIVILILFSLHSSGDEKKLTSDDFQNLLQSVAAGWNQGDAQKAADCFTEDAIYTEPPDRQIYQGRQRLFEFFGGNKGRPGAMSMTWHHMVFDETKQIGAGEFTFTYGSTVHGVTMIKIRNGKISNWREYWYESPLEWKAFIGINNF
jgi:ketosteroid isomerase-like protein